jgi:hypothetical protein
LREWLDEFAERFGEREEVAFALEVTTGWRYVIEELHRASIEDSPRRAR